VYVTLGSSGQTAALPVVLDAAASLGCQVMVATAGRTKLGDVPPRAHVATYLPGHLAARRAEVVISNGGSTTSYQALAEGRPVLGLPFNLDQYLAMQAIEASGAGLALRAGALTREQVRDALARLLGEASFKQAALRTRAEFGRWPATARFGAFLDEVTGRGEASAGRPRAVERPRAVVRS
jgi:UDP:flavonoid glycosyltransferase YjiC (YdhE family)